MSPRRVSRYLHTPDLTTFCRLDEICCEAVGQRVQQATIGHRGRAGDPLYKARRTLHTGAGLLTDKQRARLEAVFQAEEHVQAEATWGIYQRIVAAYREPDKTKGKQLMRTVINSVTSDVPAALSEIRRLDRTR